MMPIVRVLFFSIVPFAVVHASLVPAQQVPPADDPEVVFDQAVDDFFNGNIEASADGFDRVARLVPHLAPRLWQRGITLYYAGRYRDCREQFEAHRRVNPNDVENAAWHFLCVAKEESPDDARLALLPVGPDPRLPMRQVYELYAGTLTPDEVMSAADGRLDAEFYAHLYLGLFAEALGETDVALSHIRAAAAPEYAQVGGYMHTVARVHLSLIEGGQTR